MSIKKIDTRVDFIAEEHDVLAFWKENDTFEKRRKLNKASLNGVLLMGL